MLYEDFVMRGNPSGYWPLNETAGTTARNLGSVSSVDGTYTNGPVVGGNRGIAGDRATYLTAGSSNLVSVPDNAAWSPTGGAGMIFECWVWPDAWTNFSYLLGKGGAGGPTYEYTVRQNASGQIVWDVFNSGGSNLMGPLTSSAAMPLRRWTHVAVSYASGRASIFINGVRDATTTSSNSGVSDTTNPLEIGRRSDFGTTWPGIVAHAAYYQGLTETAEAQLMIASNHAIGRRFLARRVRLF